MESIHVSFDDKRIMGLADMDDHEELHFENEAIFSDSTNSDEQSNSDCDQNTANSGETLQVHDDEANVEGEHQNVSDSTQDSSSSENADSNSSENTNSNSDSTIVRGATENDQQNQESMDQGGGSNDESSQLPHARKWTKSHTPDLIIGNPEAGVQTRTATANECFCLLYTSPSPRDRG